MEHASAAKGGNLRKVLRYLQLGCGYTLLLEPSEIKKERSLGYSDHSDHSHLKCNMCLDNLPASFIFKMDSFLEYFISAEETLQEKKQIKVEITEELKDTCWLKERIYESQIRFLKENYNWDVFKREMKGGGGDISHKDRI